MSKVYYLCGQPHKRLVDEIQIIQDIQILFETHEEVVTMGQGQRFQKQAS